MGLVIGSETSGGISDIYIHDNELGLCDSCENTVGTPCTRVKTIQFGSFSLYAVDLE